MGIVSNELCDSSDPWTLLFFVKTFGSALITGGIAFLAFRIASSQRVIASNKYNLDLFDRRYVAFSEYETAQLEIENLKHPEIEDPNTYNDIIKCAKKCVFLFPKLEKGHLFRATTVSPLNKLIESHKKFVIFKNKLKKSHDELNGASNVLSSMKSRLSKNQYDDKNKLLEDIKKQEILHIDKNKNYLNMKTIFLKFQISTFTLSHLSIKYMKKYLQVPQNPY